jgi:hypothetical protein
MTGYETAVAGYEIKYRLKDYQYHRYDNANNYFRTDRFALCFHQQRLSCNTEKLIGKTWQSG